MTKQSRRPGSQKEDENREQGTGNRRWRLLLFLFLFPIPYSLVPAFAQTPVQVLDTLYNADGTKASGRIVISWDPFTPAGGGATVDGGNKTYTIPATGASAGVVNVSLYSNVGATPSGTSYRARYFLANGANYTETWVVPATGPVTIAAVRVSVVPSPTITFNPTTQLYNSAGAQGDLLVGSATAGYFSRLAIGSNGLCLTSNGTTAAWASCATGSGITSLNGQFGTTQTFSRVNDTNVTLTISSAANDHGFTMGWAGALGLARGGTNQTSWTAARCVRVNNTGTSLESAAADCGAGGGGGGHTIQEEGSNLPQQGSLNFVGAALTAADDAANSRTNVTLSQSPASASVVGTGRAINTTSPLSGGGDLTADRTLSCPTCEVTGNKNAASGYAGLTASTKLNAPQGQEVWALADLSDAAITTPATAQTVRYNGSAWVNAALGFADLSGSATAGQVPNLENLNGTLDLANGGTNATSWTAARCVRVNAGGTALESAAADCGSGGSGDSITVNGTAVADADFDDATPAASGEATNVTWAQDGGSPANTAARYTAVTTVQEEGTSVTQRKTVNFVGRGVIVDDNSSKTRVRVCDVATMVCETEEFVGGGTSTGTFGKLGWISGSSGAGTVGPQAAEAGAPGIIRINSGATASTGFTGMATAGASFTTLHTADTFDVMFRVRLNVNDGNTIARIGVTDSAVSAAPTDGFYIEKEAADTTWFFVVNPNTGGEARTDSTVSTSTSFVNLRIRRVDATNVGFSINGGTETNIAFTANEAFVAFGQIGNNNAAENKSVDADYFDLLITGLSR